MMTYTPPERTPRKPPSVWKNEEERRVWFAMNRPPPPPAPDRPTRDSSRKPYIKPPRQPSRLWQAILSFIDWLNRLAGAEKPKEKINGEQMATLSELFEGYEDIDRERGTAHCKAQPPPPPLPPQPPTRDVTRM